jgi:hypothetical protein
MTVEITVPSDAAKTIAAHLVTQIHKWADRPERVRALAGSAQSALRAEAAAQHRGAHNAIVEVADEETTLAYSIYAILAYSGYQPEELGNAVEDAPQTLRDALLALHGAQARHSPHLGY